MAGLRNAGEALDLSQFDPSNPRVQVILLAERIERQNEQIVGLETRLEKMERSYYKGAGVLIALSVVGGLVGTILAYGKTIFKPWTS